MAFRLPSFSSSASGRPRGQTRWGDWVVVSAIALCLALAANLFWVLVAPIGSIGNWKARPQMVLSATEREALFASFDPFARTASQAEGSTNVTSLSLTLFGTQFNEFTGGGAAILAGADGLQQSYAVGQEVMPGVILSQVAFDHVIFTHNGVQESLYLDQSVPAQTVGQTALASSAPTSPTEPEPVPKGEVKLNADSFREAISATPRNENGRVSGLVLKAIGDGTLFRTAGIVPGDVLVSINGNPVGAVSDIAAQLRPGTKLSLIVERGSRKIPVALILE